MSILIVTDAWEPQVNGVVRTLRATRDELRRLGHQVHFVTPQGHASIPCPSYPQIRLTMRPGRAVATAIETFIPDTIHIATEGPLGMAARRYCLRDRWPFTTAFHTKFPEYIEARWGVPAWLGYAWLRRFHAPAHSVLVATQSFKRELEDRGFSNVVLWSRGVDLQTFNPGARGLQAAPRPVFLYVGRIAIEKNLQAFLDLDIGGSKWVVGDGPQREALRRAYPNVNFVGAQSTQLPYYYRSADVMVFPSRTDTIGLVMIQALACGTPVAAYPVPGPIDVIGTSGAGALDEDLAAACKRALSLRREDARERAEQFSWRNATAQFLRHLEVIDRSTARRSLIALASDKSRIARYD